MVFLPFHEGFISGNSASAKFRENKHPHKFTLSYMILCIYMRLVPKSHEIIGNTCLHNWNAAG